MVWVLVAVLVVVALAVLAPRMLRNQRLDEVERFHRARAMTTEWSRAGVTRPVFADDAARDTVDADDLR